MALHFIDYFLHAQVIMFIFGTIFWSKNTLLYNKSFSISSKIILNIEAPQRPEIFRNFIMVNSLFEIL